MQMPRTSAMGSFVEVKTTGRKSDLGPAWETHGYFYTFDGEYSKINFSLPRTCIGKTLDGDKLFCVKSLPGKFENIIGAVVEVQLGGHHVSRAWNKNIVLKLI
jgi:hypothetical protein